MVGRGTPFTSFFRRGDLDPSVQVGTRWIIHPPSTLALKKGDHVQPFFQRFLSIFKIFSDNLVTQVRIGLQTFRIGGPSSSNWTSTKST